MSWQERPGLVLRGEPSGEYGGAPRCALLGLKHDPFCYNTIIKDSDKDIAYATTEERDFRCGAGV